MNSSINPDRHRQSHYHSAQYEQSQLKNMPSLEDIWSLHTPSHTGQHMSFERSPPLSFLYFQETAPHTSHPHAHFPLSANRDRSESGSINSRYCDVENCDEKCSNDCEEDCDDTCSVVRCNGDCNLNDLDDNCEDCLRYNDNTCKDKNCEVQNCDGCQPCDEVCTHTEEAECTSAHGPVCYSTNCGIPPPQQCSFASCFPTAPNTQGFLLAGGQDVISLNHEFPMGYNLSHNLQFPMPTIDDQYNIHDRPRKRRREDRPLVIQNTNRASSATRTPTVFDQDSLSHSHLPSPVIDDQYNYLCHWGESCQMGFTNYCALDDHVLQAHIRSQNGFACQWAACGEAEKDLDQLVDHVKTSHTSNSGQGNGHVCLWQGCNATFTNSKNLSDHLTTVHLQSPVGGLQCQWEACGVQADGLDGLSTHLHRDHFVPASSEHPGFSSSSKSPSLVPPEQELICQWCEVEGGEICGKQFTTADNLQQHVKDDHIAVLKKKTGYFCLWAGCTRRDKQFSQKGKVERHMQTHTGYKSCRCHYCDKEFSAPQALQQHIRTHTGEKPYKCDICGKEFAQGSAMTMHKRVHTGERPLMCDFPGCGKRFSESSNLSKHRKTHNPVGQHRCPYPDCDRSFHRIDQMKRHLKTHNEFILSPSPTASVSAIPEQLILLEPVQI